MKTRSAKNKGKRLQNNVRDLLLETFSELEPDDIGSQIMGVSGEDIVLSPAARRLIPYSFECKNQEKLNIWESLKQAESNSEKGKPVLIFKRNRSKTYAVLEIQDFIDLIKQKRVFNNKKYLPFIVLKYNINCDSETILNNNWNKNYLTVEKNISDYIFEDSVAMLNDLNSMFIVMKNYKPKNNKTKKVFIKTKKRKTRRCY